MNVLDRRSHLAVLAARDTAAPPMTTIPPLLSVVIPAHNEADNLPILLREVATALEGRVHYEVIVVDDASDDATAVVLAAERAARPPLRVLRHARNSGQSTALINGVRAARGHYIATLDGDGQNDPADLPALLAQLRDATNPRLKLVQGWRRDRRDTPLKRLSSRIANGIRGRLLGDGTPDSGCGIRVVERSVMLTLPAFDHMHRFIPALVRQAGWEVASRAVNHRPRGAGQSHYGLWNRLWVGIVDLLGVAWLGLRSKVTGVSELDSGGAHP
jgi:dolichol-phosphate mannosyltransferase